MKKGLLCFVVLFVASGILYAQKEELMLKSGEKGFFVEHKITAKENFYSIGRMFNVPPKTLASFNSLDMSKGLSIGQVIRIPLIEENFSQNVNEGMPLYAAVSEKENLTKVSNGYNKVSVENLKMWNKLSSDNAGSHKSLIVGFLTSGELAKANHIVIENKGWTVYVPKSAKETAEETKKPETVTNATVNKTEEKATVKEEPKKEEAVKEVVDVAPSTNQGVGYFKNSFEQQVKVYPLSKNETVTSGIFKTISGWQDAKYYALMDGVDPGTVIKVTNPSNNKSIYAKVLGAMKGIRQNKGLDIRISDAAQSTLKISDPDKFIVKVNY